MTHTSPHPHAAPSSAMGLLIRAIWCIGAMALAPSAMAEKTPTDKAAVAKPSRSKAAKRSQQVRIQPQRSSSEETPTQRDRRLYRECQGRPNAGACAGYTQKPTSAPRH